MLKYVGKTVEIIYCGNGGSITQRRIEVQAVENHIVKAFCYQRRALRVFRIENVLAVQPVVRHAG
ncbi:hypothetical protein ET33_21370 [Paenibacillus tyrfis]|uniref:WYL domain-containing protein n=2 Tax=Paenibacillus tyrfis TaxID=1501230 RepID=A0A081NWS0_9BACL|nr:hypothetical protein ET33_21370 [Paenibacillus tyrfis]